MKVYNTRRLTQNQRFIQACVVGTLTAFVLAIVVGVINSELNSIYSIISMGAAYLLGIVIQKVGRGVQERFSILAAGLTVVMIFASICFTVGGFQGLISLEVYKYAFSFIFGFGDVSSILMLVSYGLSVMIAYQKARII